MNMRLAYFIFVLMLAAPALGQTPVFVDAKPRFEVRCPEEIVWVGSEFTVSAAFGPVKRGTPIYNWTVSTGTIVRGQGTPSITITAEQEQVSITARLEIGGGPFWFEPLIESCTVGVASLPKARLLDEFGVKNIGYVEMRFDTLFADLWNDPTARGVIVISAARDTERARLKRWARRLMRTRKFDPARIAFVEERRSRVGLFTLWIVPVGAEPPEKWRTK